MKWIRANERLPKKRHNYFVKMLSSTRSVVEPYIWNATCLFDGEKFVDDINVSFLRNGNAVVEWLDESPIEDGEDGLWKELLDFLNSYNSQNTSTHFYFPLLELKSKFHITRKTPNQ